MHKETAGSVRKQTDGAYFLRLPDPVRMPFFRPCQAAHLHYDSEMIIQPGRNGPFSKFPQLYISSKYRFIFCRSSISLTVSSSPSAS